MDTEEHLELKDRRFHGKPETDEGPYYHDSWWEAYKGSVKGKLGGSIVGTFIGTLVGVGVAAILAPTAGLAVAAVTVAGFAGAGLLYGAHEFSDVGKVTGAVAAAQETAEKRMKNFETGKFAELSEEIKDVKDMLKGKKPSDVPAADRVAKASADYRTTHCDDHCEIKDRKPIFWKVAAFGALVGAAAGVVLAAAALSTHILAGVIAAEVITKAGVFAASVVGMSAFGASFGINRDAFRHVFDQTDMWFKGMLSRQNGGHAHDVEIAKVPPKREVTTVVSDNFIAYPTSETYHRDRVLAAAEKALQNFDHTRATPQ